MSNKYPILDNKKWLHQQYWENGLTLNQIAKKVGCGFGTAQRALSNIPKRAHSEVMSGKNNPNYGKLPSEETRQKMSASQLGRTHSEETKRKMSNSRKGKRQTEETKRKRAETLRGRHPTEETKQKIREARKRQRFPTTRTVIECTFWKISKKNNIPSEYTGDSKIWIGNLNPDFIIRAKRVAIFINGDYWHSPLLNHKLNPKRTVTHQIAVCKKHRWKAVTIWGIDLDREDAEAFVLLTLKKAGVI